MSKKYNDILDKLEEAHDAIRDAIDMIEEIEDA